MTIKYTPRPVGWYKRSASTRKTITECGGCAALMPPYSYLVDDLVITGLGKAVMPGLKLFEQIKKLLHPLSKMAALEKVEELWPAGGLPIQTT